ncbi:MAG: ABC transporter ATP-binding protein [bacterium]
MKQSMLYGMYDIIRDFAGVPVKSDQLRKTEFWALQDVSFELKRGECLGLIGANGSGKSTLLKLLNGIFLPDKGNVEVKGRTGALIELGAGFHPMLSGRENIYISGAILGLTKKEIDERFDSIVEFSELEDFIDTPVKFYSSGMYVRLGFAVAVHLEPDVLLIDEVLAVGDAGFRSKCYKFISETLEKAGIIFVSHNLSAVSRICSRVLVLDEGKVVHNGKIEKGILKYKEFFPSPESSVIGTGEARITNLAVKKSSHEVSQSFQYGEKMLISFDVEVDRIYEEYIISISLSSHFHEIVAQCHSLYNNVIIKNNGTVKHIEVLSPELCLNPGTYYLNIIVFDPQNIRHLCWMKSCSVIRIEGEFIGGAYIIWDAEWKISS